MRASACSYPVALSCSSPSSRQISFVIPNPNQHQWSPLGFKTFNVPRATDGGRRAKASLSSSSPWDDKPYEVLSGGRIVYLDEQDVVTFLDPPKELIPLDPASFNPAAYLWKKIEDIPEERRNRLLRFLKPRLISRAWEVAGTRYEDPKLSKRSASNLLSDGLELWNCRTSGGFPRPAKHPWPFNDQVVMYIRPLGPGVMVAQAWQEGEALEKLPQKLCGEILMVKDYATFGEKQ